MDPLTSTLRESPVDSPIEASAEIKDRYLASLAPRNGQTEQKYCRSYELTKPKNEMERLHITPEQEEEIRFHFAMTSSIPKTVSATGLDTLRVRAVVFNPDSSQAIAMMRDRLRVSVMDRIGETQAALLDAMQDEHKLANASLREIANVFSEITSSQVSLKTAERELAGTLESSVDPADLFSGDELEYMAFLSRRVHTNRPSALRESPVDPYGDNEIIDVQPSVVDPGFEPLPPIAEPDLGENWTSSEG